MDTELVVLGAKPGCLEYLIKAGLEQVPVVEAFIMMMMIIVIILNLEKRSEIRREKMLKMVSTFEGLEG